MPLDHDVDLSRIAATTPGMVGADLANLVNEAALLAARRNHEAVTEADFADALERIILGAERQIMIGPDDRRRTAYHEAGHAIVGMLTAGRRPRPQGLDHPPRRWRSASPSPRPTATASTTCEPEIQAKIKVALGGRTAEEVVYGEISTGAESDIQQLTDIARQMVGRWGMSPTIGPVAVLPRDGSGPLLPGAAETSPDTQALIDVEVRRIIDDRAPRGHHAAAGPPRQARRAGGRAARARDAGRGRRLRGRRRRPRGSAGSARAVARRRAG